MCVACGYEEQSETVKIADRIQTLHIPGAVVKVHTLCRFFSEV